ncbi:hypothetical protein E3N88_07064 [Mikania micrantha]|uniref:Uncharacterized protein n=1 Tax=Mikania micrantha TaxID=192012 RepID=A0A5N6PQI3_9ASTR|nr:hypothetical protein E3N88_07064 [Mikania micrantha]
MDSSRYATTLWREASWYAKQIGSRDSRIPSRYAKFIFDRPSRSSALNFHHRHPHSSPLVPGCYSSNLCEPWSLEVRWVSLEPRLTTETCGY